MYPAITVLEALKLGKDSVLWVGGRGGMEEALVTRRDIPFATIPAAGVHGVGLIKLPGNFWQLLRGVISSRRILRAFNPDILLFTGGYLAFPMAVAAMRRPALLYVPDIEPGLALKALARFAAKIALTAEESRPFFPNQQKLVVTGYPVRPGLKDWTREKSLAYFNFDPEIPTLAVAGGSKGARSINNALMKILPELLENIQVIHLTGHLDWEKIEANAQTLTADQASRYQAFPYLHEMGAALGAADLIVSRAGASILGEYPLFGLPAILVPYPHAWRYQKVNANYLADRGAAVVLNDEDLDVSLKEKITRLIFDRQALDQMSGAMSALSKPDAADRIAALLRELANKQDGGLPA